MNFKYCNVDQCHSCGDLHVCVPEDYGMNIVAVKFIQDEIDESPYALWDTIDFTYEVQLGRHFVVDTCCGCDRKLKNCICRQLSEE